MVERPVIPKFSYGCVWLISVSYPRLLCLTVLMGFGAKRAINVGKNDLKATNAGVKKFLLGLRLRMPFSIFVWDAKRS